MSHDPGWRAGMRAVFEPAGLPLLVLLVAADLAFIGLHLGREWTPWINDWRFSITQDRGYPEVYQYVKEFWIALMLGGLWLRTREIGFLAWAILFGYLMCDDAMRIHEQGGVWIAGTLGLEGFFGMRGSDVGELIFDVLVGIPLLAMVGAGHLRGPERVRRVTRDLLLLLGVILFFGVVLDAVHMAAHDVPGSIVLVWLEDGGEMLGMSVTGGYVFALGLRGGEIETSLWDLLRSRVRRA